MQQTRFVTAFLGAVLSAGALHAQADLVTIPNGFSASDITPDGSVVVGTASGGGFYWRWQVDPAPTPIGGNSAVAVSDDGLVITGDIDDPVTGAQAAGIWTQATGWQSLGGISQCGSLSSAYDISGDGTTVVGLTWESCSGRAFKWTQADGMVALETLGSGANRASSISRNGALAGGFAQGTSNRTPAIWLTSGPGFLLDIDAVGEIFGFSDDAQTYLGKYEGEAFYEDVFDGFVNLGTLIPGWSGNATDISKNGNRIIGYDNQGFGLEAWVWSEETGLEQLQGKLSALGVPNVPLLGAATAMTPDGKYITVQTTFGGAYIVTLPDTDCGFNKYGEGIAPANVLDLAGAGDPSVGGMAGTVTTGASSAVFTFISFGSSAIPIYGGSALIDVGSIFFTFAEPSVGGVSTTMFPVPNNPAFAGVTFYFQSVSPDAGQPFGWALSNGLQMYTCP